MGGLWSKKEETDHTNARKRFKGHGTAVTKAPYLQRPYVLKRVSSMFFDEDGDLAHEFYEECRVTDSTSYDTVVRWTMRRIKNGLVPQGEVDLPMPRLHVDFPVLLVENV